eukprot:541972-Pleurochrysis_carterae.AAC.1
MEAAGVSLSSSSSASSNGSNGDSGEDGNENVGVKAGESGSGDGSANKSGGCKCKRVHCASDACRRWLSSGSLQGCPYRCCAAYHHRPESIASRLVGLLPFCW